MINLLSSNLIALPDLPSFSRRKTKPRRAPERRRAHGIYCPKEISRWENEGGAIGGESTRNKITLGNQTGQKTAAPDRAANEIMKQTNHHEEMIRYGEPLTSSSRRRQRRYPAMGYNDRSPEVAAMNAHLRATSYPEPAEETRSHARAGRKKPPVILRNRTHPFLHLGKQYDILARDNFVKEAVFFVLIVALAAWPIVHAVQAIIAWW